MREVSVVNRSPNTFTDAHEGVQYVFEPGKKVAIPVAAAIHIFGFGLDNRFVAMRRLGFSEKEKGEAFLSNFDLKMIEYVAKEDAEETEALRVLVEDKERQNAELREKLLALETEIDQLKSKAHKKSKE